MAKKMASPSTNIVNPKMREAIYGTPFEFDPSRGAHVQWISQEDDSVCKVCKYYNDLIFPVANAPSKPHSGCRCGLILVDWQGNIWDVGKYKVEDYKKKQKNKFMRAMFGLLKLRGR